jgi:hypothetical protein
MACPTLIQVGRALGARRRWTGRVTPLRAANKCNSARRGLPALPSKLTRARLGARGGDGQSAGTSQAIRRAEDCPPYLQLKGTFGTCDEHWAVQLE